MASGPRLGRSSAWGVPPPGPPGLRPLCAFAHGHPLPADQEEGRGGLSTLSEAIVGSARPQGLRAKSPLPHEFIKPAVRQAKRVRPSAAPCGQGGAAVVHVVNAPALSTCAA